MRVLILGGAGFIGYHLAASLVSDGHEVRIVDDLSRGAWDIALRHLRADVRVTDLTIGPWPDGQWDHVYLLAAVVGVPNVERAPLRTVEVNTRIVLRVLRWLMYRPGQRLFFASTSEVYAGWGGATPIPTPEDISVAIRDVNSRRAAYAASKILGEVALLQSAAHVTIGRFHNIYGPRMGTDHVIPDLCVRFARRDNPVRVLGPECRRAYCYVSDAVRAMRAVMETPSAIGQIVNIGDDTKETSVTDLVGELSALTGHQPALDIQPAPAGSVLRRCPDLTKLRRLTGYEPSIGLSEGLNATYAWYSR